MNIHIRKAAGADLKEIVRLLAEDPFSNNREDFREPLPVCYSQAFEAIESDKNNLLLVAESELGTVGTLQITFVPSISFKGGTRMLIEAIMVDGRCRGQGIGSQMLRFAIELAKEKQCRFVQLTTNKRRQDAHRFYERLGFAPTHEGMKLDITF